MKSILVLVFMSISPFLFSQNPNDCAEAILVCGNVNLGLEPDGVGFDEFSLAGNQRPLCYTFNNNTIWLQFDFETDGVFTFALSPTNGSDDYDFAVYGPNVSCTALGNPIRCSSTNPFAASVSANTGLGNLHADTTEGPGADGNGFLRAIDVNAGDTYFVLIDRAHGSGGFDIDYTGSSSLPNQPNANYTGFTSICETDDSIDGITSFNFDTLTPTILGNQSAVVTYHDNLNDASIGINPLPNTYNNISGSHIIYYRIENTLTGCFDTNSFEAYLDSPFGITIPEDLFFCTNLEEPVVITIDSGYAYYEWSTGEEGPDLDTIYVSNSGMYSVIVTNDDGCKVQEEIIVKEVEISSITDVEVNDFNNYNGNSATIYIIGTGDYEYAVDQQSTFTENNTFENLSAGFHIAYVRSQNNCGTVSEPFFILDYPRVMTPNNDGINDKWNIEGIEYFPSTIIRIFDRYGKLLKELNPQGDGWDGTFKGIEMPTDDYWFTIYLEDGRKYNNHFTLKR